jgi:hypothetical protein
MLKVIDPRDSRAYTVALLELVDEGVLDKDTLIQDLLGWMSEDDVAGFCKKNLRDEDSNECLIGPEVDEVEDELDPLDDFNYVGSRYHY